MSANMEQEARENARWRLKINGSGTPFHQHLLHNEFLSVEAQQQARQAALRRILQHCYDVVPYYRELFSNQGIRRRHLREPGILAKVPPLSRADITAHAARLRATELFSGHAPAGETRTSGTTGEPVSMLHSDYSLSLFTWLKQRELRWFRFDPMASMMSIRPVIELPSRPDGKLLREGECLRVQGWPYVQRVFETGESWSFNNTNTIADQVARFNQVKPSYLVMQSSCLEFLSLQSLDDEALSGLAGAMAISNTLTPAMRSQVEAALQCPVYQNYGLNEVGLVASQCPVSGNYHVHAEHAIVEVVREDGSPCDQGERGRLLVTSLSNSAMPLIRYDADDFAEAVYEPCACGRSLPSLGQIVGRYRRTAYLPEGTLQRWGAIQFEIYHYGQQAGLSLNRYQATQDREGNFMLRLDCEPEVFHKIRPRIHRKFEQAYPGPPLPKLFVMRTSQFVEAGHKFQNFISDCTPRMDQ